MIKQELQKVLTLIEKINPNNQMSDSDIYHTLLAEYTRLKAEIKFIEYAMSFIRPPDIERILDFEVTDEIKTIAADVITRNPKMERVTKIVKALCENGIKVDGNTLGKKLIETGMFFINQDGHWSHGM
jgi:hypothetical protein